MPFTKKHSDKAKLSKHSYNYKNLNEGDTVSECPEYQVVKVIDSKCGKLHAVDYRNTESNEVTTIYVGSELKNYLAHDLPRYKNKELHKDCISFVNEQVERTKIEYSKENHELGGHSLGGGMATFHSILTGSQAHVFDSIGIGASLINECQTKGLITENSWRKIYYVKTDNLISELNSDLCREENTEIISHRPQESDTPKFMYFMQQRKYEKDRLGLTYTIMSHDIDKISQHIENGYLLYKNMPNTETSDSFYNNFKTILKKINPELENLGTEAFFNNNTKPLLLIESFKRKIDNSNSQDIETIYNDSFSANNIEYDLRKLLEQQFTSPKVKAIISSGLPLTEDLLNSESEKAEKNIELIISKLSNQDSTSEKQNREGALITNNFFNQNEFSSIVKDVSILANIFNKPHLSNSLAQVNQGFERYIVGFEKLHNSTNNLVKISSALSIVTGITSIFSGIFGLFGLFNSGADRRLENISKQLDNVIQNQLKTYELLQFNTRQLEEIKGQIERFAEVTGKRLDFISVKDLISSVYNLHSYLYNTNPIPLEQSDIKKFLITIDTWLNAKQHLCSPQMNGAILNLNQKLPSEESIKFLTNYQSHSVTNIFGFIVRQLQHLGCEIDNKYLNLPPLEIYLHTLLSYYEGLGKLDNINQHGCITKSEDILEIYNLYKDFFEFLNSDKFWEDIIRKYLNSYDDSIELIINELKSFRNTRESLYRNLMSLMNNILNNDSKLKIQNTLNNLEEIYTLIKTISKLIGNYEYIIGEQLPNKENILRARVYDILEYTSRRPISYRKGLKLTEPLGLKNDSKLIMSTPFKLILNDTRNINNKIFKENKLLDIASANAYTYRDLSTLIILMGAGYNDKCYSYATQKYNDEEIKNFYYNYLNKYSEGIQNAYSFYKACYNNITEEIDKIINKVQPEILLWVVSILGNYKIFKKIKYSHLDYSMLSYGSASRDLNIESESSVLINAARYNHVDVIEGFLESPENKFALLNNEIRNSPAWRVARVAYTYDNFEIVEIILALSKDVYKSYSRYLNEDYIKKYRQDIKKYTNQDKISFDILNAIEEIKMISDAIRNMGANKKQIDFSHDIDETKPSVKLLTKKR